MRAVGVLCVVACCLLGCGEPRPPLAAADAGLDGPDVGVADDAGVGGGSVLTGFLVVEPRSISLAALTMQCLRVEVLREDGTTAALPPGTAVTVSSPGDQFAPTPAGECDVAGVMGLRPGRTTIQLHARGLSAVVAATVTAEPLEFLMPEQTVPAGADVDFAQGCGGLECPAARLHQPDGSFQSLGFGALAGYPQLSRSLLTLRSSDTAVVTVMARPGKPAVLHGVATGHASIEGTYGPPGHQLALPAAPVTVPQQGTLRQLDVTLSEGATSVAAGAQFQPPDSNGRRARTGNATTGLDSGHCYQVGVRGYFADAAGATWNAAVPATSLSASGRLTVDASARACASGGGDGRLDVCVSGGKCVTAYFPVLPAGTTRLEVTPKTVSVTYVPSAYRFCPAVRVWLRSSSGDVELTDSQTLFWSNATFMSWPIARTYDPTTLQGLTLNGAPCLSSEAGPSTLSVQLNYGGLTDSFQLNLQ